MARERRDPLVHPRVVLHRARAERVGPGVEVEVAPRDPVVVADDLGLGDLGELGGLRAQEALGDQLGDRRLGNVGRRQDGGAAALDRALEDRDDRVALLRRGGAGVRGRRRGGGWAGASLTTQPPSGLALSPRYPGTKRHPPRRSRRRASPRGGRCPRRSAARSGAISSPSAYSVVLPAEPIPGGDPVLGAAIQHRRARRARASRRTPATTGASWSSSTPSMSAKRSRA